MSQLAKLQQQFMQVLLGESPSQLVGAIVTQGHLKPLTRIDIYCNAYYQRLKECMAVDHEILSEYLGDALFEQMASGYIAAYPSEHFSLRYFCDQLPNFLTQAAPFNGSPMLAELARFERMLLTTFDAPDASVATTDQLKQLPAPQWPYLRFHLHPSVQWYQSRWNTVAIWQALKQQQAPPDAQRFEQNWLIWRNAERLTEFCSLDLCGSILLEGLIQGINYADLCEQLAACLPVEQVSQTSLQCLLGWLDNGIISTLEADDLG